MLSLSAEGTKVPDLAGSPSSSFCLSESTTAMSCLEKDRLKLPKKLPRRDTYTESRRVWSGMGEGGRVVSVWVRVECGRLGNSEKGSAEEQDRPRGRRGLGGDRTSCGIMLCSKAPAVGCGIEV